MMPPFIHSINPWIVAHKDAITLLLAMVVAFVGLQTYRKNSRTQRAELIYKLHSDFFVSSKYKSVRDNLDSLTDNQKDREGLLTKKLEHFVDYLNFFEMIAYLKKRKQLKDQDVEALFGYYLDLLQRHDAVIKYLNEYSFENLIELLNSRKNSKRNL